VSLSTHKALTLSFDPFHKIQNGSLYGGQVTIFASYGFSTTKHDGSLRSVETETIELSNLMREDLQIDTGANHVPRGLTNEELSKYLTDEFNRLPLGGLASQIPDTMQQCGRYPIKISVVQDLSDTLLAKLAAQGIVISETINVSSFMEAHISGSSFQIHPFSPEKQFILIGGYTQWEYEVVPLESGIQIIHISIYARLKLPNGSEETKPYPVYVKDVRVYVNWWKSIKFFASDIWTDIKNHLISFIIGGLSLTTVIEWFRRYKKRKDENQSKLILR
jgi:hypothetical protein